MANDKQPTTIKKYANRRLYNTGTSAYVTLEDLAEMLKKGEDFVVYDAKTGEEITRSVLTQIIFEAEKKASQYAPLFTLREIIQTGRALRDVDLVGTSNAVARKMSDIIEEVGGDGYLITDPELTRRYISEIADGLVPALQKLGVVRKAYDHVMLRDNLLAF